MLLNVSSGTFLAARAKLFLIHSLASAEVFEERPSAAYPGVVPPILLSRSAALHAGLSPVAASQLARVITPSVQPILRMPIEIANVEDYSVAEGDPAHFKPKLHVVHPRPQSSLSSSIFPIPKPQQMITPAEISFYYSCSIQSCLGSVESIIYNDGLVPYPAD
jgi:hypothetical protein